MLAVSGFLGVERLDDAEVAELRVVLLVEKDVRGLDVAVHDPRLVDHLERLEHRSDDAERPLHTERSGAKHQIAERASGKQLHHQHPRLHVDVVDRHDRGVPQTGDGARFALEARRSGLVVVERGVERLDRHLPAQLPVERADDVAHAAATEVAHDVVARRDQRSAALAL